MKKVLLWEIIDQTKGELIDLCAALVQRPNVNPPIEADAITEYILSYLDRYGIRYEKLEPHQGIPVIIAEVGEGADVLCFNGHSDTVPTGDRDRWDFDPYSGTVTEKQILGRGTSDMLCGLAIDLHLLRMIQQRKLRLGGRVRLHIVSDEESGGRWGTRWLCENGYCSDIQNVVIGEPTSWNNVETGCKGGLRALIKCSGSAAHGSVCSFVGDNAITKMVKILHRVSDMRELYGETTPGQEQVVQNAKQIAKELLKAPGVENAIDHVNCNLMHLSCGLPGKQETEYCEALIDFRVPNGLTTDDVKTRLYQIVEELGVSGVSYEYIHETQPTYTPVDAALVQSAVRNASAVWNRTVIPAYQWASSDGIFYRGQGIPTIQYGPANVAGIHSYNENADLEDIVNCAKVHFSIMQDLVGID